VPLPPPVSAEPFQQAPEPRGPQVSEAATWRLGERRCSRCQEVAKAINGLPSSNSPSFDQLTHDGIRDVIRVRQAADDVLAETQVAPLNCASQACLAQVGVPVKAPSPTSSILLNRISPDLDIRA